MNNVTRALNRTEFPILSGTSDGIQYIMSEESERTKVKLLKFTRGRTAGPFTDSNILAMEHQVKASNEIVDEVAGLRRKVELYKFGKGEAPELSKRGARSSTRKLKRQMRLYPS